MNPCPCGRLGSAERPCACTPGMVAAYCGRVSGPLRDRFDVRVEMPPVPIADLRRDARGEGSSEAAVRVAAARRLQEERFAGERISSNAAMTPEHLRRHAPAGEPARRILGLAMRRLGLSTRAHDGALEVARTIADLEGSAPILPAHVAEAVQYRTLDRQLPGTGES